MVACEDALSIEAWLMQLESFDGFEVTFALGRSPTGAARSGVHKAALQPCLYISSCISA